MVTGSTNNDKCVWFFSQPDALWFNLAIRPFLQFSDGPLPSTLLQSITRCVIDLLSGGPKFVPSIVTSIFSLFSSADVGLVERDILDIVGSP